MRVETRSPGPDTGREITARTMGICGLMLLATMLNYMDRQTLAQQASQIRSDLALSNEDYGWLEAAFGLAFAVGGIATGFLADVINLRWLYPAILLGWSAVGFVTGFVTNFTELLICRIVLGFFEAGQWPCALAASQRLLAARDRPLGNSILQSGASLGAILTPLVVLALNGGGPGNWRRPFWVIGAVGLVWVVAWLTAIRPRDLEIATESDLDSQGEAQKSTPDAIAAGRSVTIRRFLSLIVVVITINFSWQYFRAWMPMMLEKEHGYSQRQIQFFSSAYYLSAGVGCVTVGYLVKWLSSRGFSVHRARMSTFVICVLLTALGIPVAFLPASWLLLTLLLAVGFGALGLFPTYYAFTQELSVRRMGKVTGIFSFVTWVSWFFFSIRIGQWIDRTGSYAAMNFLAGVAPLLALLALAVLWRDHEAPITATAAVRDVR